ncbi:MAG: DNA mismatch repair protein MutS [Candidatus Woesearchaeota archaeon]
MEDLTPAMKQYMEIKNKYRDCIVFFRMGDFYETFYDDAKITSQVLDIALTRRGIKNSDREIPLAGIPYHALESYLSKMIKQGYKVVIVEQLEDPKFAKGVVKRDVVRVVTPGTIIEEKILGIQNNFICSYSYVKDAKDEKHAFAFLDITTGDFFGKEFLKNYSNNSENNLFEEVFDFLLKIQPAEILVPSSYEKDEKIKRLKEKFFITFYSDFNFYQENAKETLMKNFNLASLEGLGLKDKELLVSCAGSLLNYVNETQKNVLSHIKFIKILSDSEFMQMDSITIDNLELFKSKSNNSKGSLIYVLDKTLTNMGSRLLKKILMSPLKDVSKINERILAVEDLILRPFLLDELRNLLKNFSDIDRLISKANFGNISPRDVISLEGSLSLIPEIKKILIEFNSDLLIKISKMDDLHELANLIDKAIADEPSSSLDEGNVIREGFNEELDKLRDISNNAKKHILAIEQKERERTGIKSLKIRYNQVFGYYIDITKSNLDLVPKDYIKKQTLVNSERYITDELKKLEEEILSADEKIIEIEKKLFNDLINEIKRNITKLQEISEDIALLDVLCSFAYVSLKNNYTKPYVNNEFDIKLKKSRHPVIEQFENFVSNDVNITEENRMMIITGPNMAGKSVFMRQVALNVIMAQIGCFVPCEEAHIGIVDKLFCRTGASDDISRGQSTFMVEMLETAQILNSADERSLIIMDEIGRGTSTYDGVAIAWAVAEYIAKKIKAKTLFATHYHVLNNLEKEIKGIKNYNIAVLEKEDKIIFLRKILEGGTDKSYGIHVAKLAGMPKEVVDRSKEIQFKLEKDDEISAKIIIETKKIRNKDKLRKEVEEVNNLIKSRQLRLDEI